MPFSPPRPPRVSPRGLRLLALVSETELTVSELVTILGQSQPRISRHLKLLVEAGLVERHREGSWVFFRIAQTGPVAGFARDVIARLAPGDVHLTADRARLEQVRKTRAAQAASYFAAQAANWDQLRALHVPEEKVEAAIRDGSRAGSDPNAARSWDWHRPDARTFGAARDPGRRASINRRRC